MVTFYGRASGKVLHFLASQFPLELIVSAALGNSKGSYRLNR